MADTFGVTVSEEPTGLLPPVETLSALVCAVGPAPIHRLPEADRANAMPGKINIANSMSEATALLGVQFSDDFKKWGLSETAFSEFNLFRKTPSLFINTFNPEEHFEEVDEEEITFVNGTATLEHNDLIGDLTLTDVGGTTIYEEGVDYTLDRVTGVLSIPRTGSALTVSSQCEAAYVYADPSKITNLDVIGGYDIATDTNTGIELIEEIFPRQRLIPSILTTPGFETDLMVSAIGSAKMSSINGVFRGQLVEVEVPSGAGQAAARYSDAPGYKANNGLTASNMVVSWGTGLVGEKEVRMSTLHPGICGLADREAGGVPMRAPSNLPLPITGMLAGGKQSALTLDQAKVLRANGIFTALNFTSGFVGWGDYTAAYPGVTDPKDSTVPFRRFFSWYGNNLVLKYFQKIDWPITFRLIETIVSSEQVYLNGLAKRQNLLGASIQFLRSENPITDLMAGTIRFHIWLGIPSPARNIHFYLEYEPNYLQALFAA